MKLPAFGALDQSSYGEQRCFSDPGDYALKSVNFAGYYVIESCSCGTACRWLFMWDARTGTVYPYVPPGSIDINVGPDWRDEYKGEQHRADSRLLTVEGCIEDTCDCLRRYYVWNGKEFRLI